MDPNSRMNDLLKFLSKTLHPLGYQIRPRNGLTFLKVPALETRENADNVGAIRTLMQTAVPVLPEGDLNSIHIVLRTCLRQHRNINPRPRLTGKDPFENGYRCVRSLIRSINHALSTAPHLKIHLTILDDRSEAAAVEILKSIAAEGRGGFDLHTTEQAGQGASLYQAFAECRAKDTLIYCVEDDYLHEMDGIYRLWEFYTSMAAQTGGHIVLYPQEHTQLYSKHYPSYIVQGADRHWRSIRHATHTFMTHGNVLNRYWCFFENVKYVGNKKKRRAGSETKTTDRLFTKIPGFSPLKPCAVHLQYEELLPPFYHWEKLWDENAADAPSRIFSAKTV